MRKLIYLLLLPLAVAVTACGGKKGSSDNQSLLARIDSIDAHGLQRMQTSKSETNFKRLSFLCFTYSGRKSASCNK